MRTLQLGVLLLVSTAAWAQDPAEADPPAPPADEDARERPEAPPAEPAPEPEPEPAEVVRPAEPATPVVERPAETVAPEVPALTASTDIWAELESMPPRYSYDLSLHAIFGQIPHYTDLAPWWPGVGIRAVWGPNFGNARVSIGGLLSAEGPVPEFYVIGIEPQVGIDSISGKLQIGASAGVGAHYYGRAAVTGLYESAWGVSPGVMARVGYSDAWSRMGRRFFVFLEPKVRLTGSTISSSFALVVGSGRGA
jgi:hypothetical protein